MICKCTSCGELLTMPIFYNGAAYGYSCIKKVNPNYKKSKAKKFFVKADTFEVETIDENTTKIYAKIDKINKTFIGFQRIWTLTDGTSYVKSDSIEIASNEAFVDLMKYKNSSELIYKMKSQ